MTTLGDESIAVDVAKQLLQINAVSINVEKPFHYASGIIGPLYTDNRLLISHPTEWKKILKYYEQVIVSTIGRNTIDVLSGTATAAIPHAAALAVSLNLPMIYVRTSKKDHGKENLIEGELIPQSRVVVIEDLVSTGGSVEHNVNAVRAAGGVVTHVVAITTSNINVFEKTVDSLGVQLHTLTNIQTVLKVAKEIGKISPEDYVSAQAFLADPPNWASNRGLS